MNTALAPSFASEKSEKNCSELLIFMLLRGEASNVLVFSLAMINPYNNIYSHVDKLKIKIEKNIALWTRKGQECY